jgi:hypothetical protein
LGGSSAYEMVVSGKPVKAVRAAPVMMASRRFIFEGVMIELANKLGECEPPAVN